MADPPKVVPLSRAPDARAYTVLDALREAIADLESGQRQATKCMVLFLDDTGSHYKVGYQQCVGSMTECVALLEVVKLHIMANEMGTVRR